MTRWQAATAALGNPQAMMAVSFSGMAGEVDSFIDIHSDP